MQETHLEYKDGERKGDSYIRFTPTSHVIEQAR